MTSGTRPPDDHAAHASPTKAAIGVQIAIDSAWRMPHYTDVPTTTWYSHRHLGGRVYRAGC